MQVFGERQSAAVWQGNAHFPYCRLQWCVPHGTSSLHWNATGPGTAIWPPAAGGPRSERRSAWVGRRSAGRLRVRSPGLRIARRVRVGPGRLRVPRRVRARGRRGRLLRGVLLAAGTPQPRRKATPAAAQVESVRMNSLLAGRLDSSGGRRSSTSRPRAPAPRLTASRSARRRARCRRMCRTAHGAYAPRARARCLSMPRRARPACPGWLALVALARARRLRLPSPCRSSPVASGSRPRRRRRLGDVAGAGCPGSRSFDPPADARRAPRLRARPSTPASPRSGTPSSADDPERAMPFFFPLGAYQQVKDIANPAVRLEPPPRRRVQARHPRAARAPRRGRGRARRSSGLDVPDDARALGRARARSTTRSATTASSARACATPSTAQPLLRRQVAHLVARRVVRRAPERHRVGRPDPIASLRK